MTDRFQSLAEQSGCGWDEKYNWYVGTQQMKKFGEAIIQECVSILNDMHMRQSVNNQNYPNAWHDAVDQGIDAIKQHFEVEE